MPVTNIGSLPPISLCSDSDDISHTHLISATASADKLLKIVRGRNGVNVLIDSD